MDDQLELSSRPALSPAERVCAVAAAAAHDLNNEMTVILSGTALALVAIGPDHAAYRLMLEVQSAAVRCAWRASSLLNFSGRYGAKASARTLDQVIEDRGVSVGR